MTATTLTVHYFSLELTDVAVIVSLWPSWIGHHSPPFVLTVMDMFCGRHGLAVMVYLLAVMDMFRGRHSLWPLWIGHHSLPIGRHGHVLWPSIFVAIIDLAVVVCGRHGIGPFLPARRYASAGLSDSDVSVCLSVRLSHAGIVPSRAKAGS